MGAFGVGQPVTRAEDMRLLTGTGVFVADRVLADEVHAMVLRPPLAHAAIGAIDPSAALALPGVLAVITAADLLASGIGDIPCGVPVYDRSGRRLPSPGRRVLARDRVRFVGEPVAVVVADTCRLAQDAADLVVVDYRPLPAVGTMIEAIASEAPELWPDAPGNVAFHWQIGDLGAVDNVFAGAAYVVSLDLVNNRVVPCALEPRSVLGTFDPETNRYTLYTGTQGAHHIKSQLAKSTLGVPADSVRVVVGDVGGGFGSKLFHYPEEALVLWAARRLGRPVKWVGSRAEAFVADTHGRAQENAIDAAFSRDGRILALRCRSRADMGAYLSAYAPANAAMSTGGMLPGAYDIPLLYAECQGIYTNTTPVDAYRGAGRPEATYAIERIMDTAARRFSMTPEEIRHRNLVQPNQMPYRTATGKLFDSGDFPTILEETMVRADRAGFGMRRAQSEARGRCRGFGLSYYVEVCGYGDETVTLRFLNNGTVELLVGTQSTGQGHETAFAQVVADGLGIPFSSIVVRQGDTDLVLTGRGSAGSRTLTVAGGAILAAVDAVIDKGRTLAARAFQADPDDVVFADGRFRIGQTGQSLGALDLAAIARDPQDYSSDDCFSASGKTLEGVGTYALSASTFPNGCHACEVEVDPETGDVEILRYTVVDDFGTVINPLLLVGQIAGGVAQGIGQALMEQAAYESETALPIATSFAAYAAPQAVDLPSLDISFHPVPCATNPLGVKGAGEAGAVAACPAVINAVVDALAPLGVHHVDMPATPEAIWRALQSARTEP